MMPLQLCWLSIMHECIEQYKSVAGNAQKKNERFMLITLNPFKEEAIFID